MGIHAIMVYLLQHAEYTRKFQCFNKPHSVRGP